MRTTTRRGDRLIDNGTVAWLGDKGEPENTVDKRQAEQFRSRRKIGEGVQSEAVVILVPAREVAEGRLPPSAPFPSRFAIPSLLPPSTSVEGVEALY